MARYIDADEFKQRLADKDIFFPALYKNELNSTPTADVVPKSEYDAVVSAVDNSTKEFLKLHDKYQDANREVERLEREFERLKKSMLPSYYSACTEEEAIKIGKQYGRDEVAREIFEEIENLYMEQHDSYAVNMSRSEFAELKKKYTEEYKDEFKG